MIRTLCRNVPAEDAKDYISDTRSPTTFPPATRRNDGQWARAKGFDTSCPLGPWMTVDPELDIDNLEIKTEVNGKVVQQGNTRDMVFDVPFLIEYISSAMTLLPGDVILTGTPAGVGPIEAGDRVECSVEGIGALGNHVVRR